MVLYRNRRILVNVIMIVYLHILTEDSTLTNGNLLKSTDRTVVVEENFVRYFYPPPDYELSIERNLCGTENSFQTGISSHTPTCNTVSRRMPSSDNKFYK